MLRFLCAALVALMFLTGPPLAAPAWAQGTEQDISETLSRLKNNPRYRGRILGTHLRQRDGEVLYEVRILRRRDDRVILVYIDPDTGGVVGDSERSARRPSRRDRDWNAFQPRPRKGSDDRRRRQPPPFGRPNRR